MGLIFRKGDPRTAKLVTLILFVPLGVALVGLLNRSTMLPSGILMPWAQAAGFIVAIGTCIAALLDRNPVAVFTRPKGLLKRGAVTLLLFAFAWGMGFCAVMLGLPTLWSSLALTPSAATASVTHVLRERTGRGCHHRLALAGGRLPEPMIPCVSEEVWKSTKVGSTVTFKFTDSRLAFIIDDIELLQ